MFILTVAPWLPPPPPVHMILERDLARLYVRRWRPKFAHGQLLSRRSSLLSYTRALAHLADPECVGLVVSSHDSAFVLHRQEHGAYAVSCILRPTMYPVVPEVRALRRWFNATHGTALVTSQRLNDEDRATWQMSQMDI